MLRELGIIGWEKIETPIIASLALGDPVLLIGGKGEGKSQAIRTIARALGKKIKTYDASKAMFEDILGIPVPAAAAQAPYIQQQLLRALVQTQLGEDKSQIVLPKIPQKGEQGIVYLETPLSLRDAEFLFIDEISRCPAQMQNKWLELVRDRTIMGLETNIKYVYAAMNPTGYAGVNTLDEALVGRFSFFLPVPNTAEMSLEDIEAIVQIEDEHDGALINKETFLGISGINRSAARKAAYELNNAILRTRHLFPSVALEYDVPHYVAMLAKTLARENILIDGRRLSMLRRNITAVLAVEMALGKPVDLDSTLISTLKVSLPIVLGQLDFSKIQIAHKVACEALEKGKSQLFNLSQLEDPIEILKSLKNQEIPPDWQWRLIEKMLAPLEEKDKEGERDDRRILRSLAALLVGTSWAIYKKIKLNAEARLHLIKKYKQCIPIIGKITCPIKGYQDGLATNKLNELLAEKDIKTTTYIVLVNSVYHSEIGPKELLNKVAKLKQYVEEAVA